MDENFIAFNASRYLMSETNVVTCREEGGLTEKGNKWERELGVNEPIKAMAR